MGLTYKNAGVDIDAGSKLVELIKPAIKSTHRQGVLSNIGGFGGLFAIESKDYKQPVLVSGTDGVGTKLRIAQHLRQHSTIGIDLVAMCVNDVIVQGAEPLFFLDYFATGKLTVEEAQAVIEGIAKGCKQANVALIGGETAEMPGMYNDGEYDLAGFCVGIVDKENLIDGSKISEDDLIIGLPSSGIHSNGFSLVNKILESSSASLEDQFGGQNLGEVLLTPTVIYTSVVLQLIQKLEVHGLCHITGGGLIDNVPRVIPDSMCAHIDTQCWNRPDIFNWLQKMGKVDDTEMYRVFNCGIGMIVILPKNQAEYALKICDQNSFKANIIGKVKSSKSKTKITLQ